MAASDIGRQEAQARDRVSGFDSEILKNEEDHVATRHLKTRPEWEGSLRSGLKTVDARLVADDIAGIEVGDILVYPGAEVRVRRVRFYPGFGDLLAYEDWSRIAPEASSREEVRTLLEKGHEATVRATGAVALELEPVDRRK